MAKNEKKIVITIPEDPQNPEYKVIPFQQDGVTFCVERGKPTEVPMWVYESAIQAKFIRRY